MSVKKMSIELNSGQICETLQENKKILEKHQKVEADLIDDIFKEIGINHEIVSFSSDEFGKVKKSGIRPLIQVPVRADRKKNLRERPQAWLVIWSTSAVVKVSGLGRGYTNYRT